MYVCLCKGITDRDITQSVRDGACSFGEVRDQLGVSTQCGKCARLARAIVEENLPGAGLSASFYDASYDANYDASRDSPRFNTATAALA